MFSLLVGFYWANTDIVSYAQAPGPGVPTTTFTSSQLFTVIGRINSSNGAPRGHGFTAMFNGYLFVIFADDAGGGNGSGGFAFLDISNPYVPVKVLSTDGNSAYGPGPNYVGDIREGHSFTFSGNNACIPTLSGLQFWDFTNVGPPANHPVKLGAIPQLTGVTGGDYAPTPWWVAWQGGRYVYVAGTSTGLHIIDASNPAAPVYVNRGPGKPNPMPTGQTGGFNVGTIFAIGNLLVITGNDTTGMATFDISDPVNPILLNVNGNSPGYSAMVNGNKILGIGDPLSVYDIGTNGAITLIRNAPDSGGKGGYGSFQDGFVHMGCSSNSAKIDIRNSSGYTVGGKLFPPDSGTDLDFNTVIGHLECIGDDHGIAATYITPHQTTPDVTPPAVNMVIPRSNAVNQALTSRVGLTFTDQIDMRSVNSSTFIVRPFGGSTLSGKYSAQTGIVNFWPDAQLLPNQTYEIVLPAGGIKDYAGNAITPQYSSLFSTGSQIITFDVTCQLIQNPPKLVGDPVTFDIQNCTGPNAHDLSYSWNFGDGSPATPFSTTSSATHAYSTAAHFSVTMTVTNGSGQRSFAQTQTITYPNTLTTPTRSSTIVYDAARQRVWCTNPDANTVTAIDAVALTKLFEPPVGKHPRTLAVAPDGNIWVANQDDNTISVLDGSTGATSGTFALPYAARPFGIAFSPAGDAAYVTLESPGELIRIDPGTRTILNTVSVGPTPRGIAVSSDGTRILVTRFISPVDHGEVVEVSGTGFNIVRTFSLTLDPGPDREDAGRGVPNYMLSVTISPDGRRAWVPAKKDNTVRGLFRDGLPLTFENAVRTIVLQLDLSTNAEVLSARRDLNDRALAAAVAFNPLGDYAFVVTLGSNTLEILDAYSGVSITGAADIGLAPQGLVLNGDGSRLFVHNYMSRDVVVFNVSDVGQGNNTPQIARINTVQTELLAPQVLQGKQIFYNAGDRKMSRDKYLSCAMCHLDGDSDNRVWDFTDRGEGLRNTISLLGRAGMRQGPVHWSANFDEIQDFEQDIRNAFNGSGFMSDALYTNGTRSTSLGDPKAGLSPELDALAAYVSSLKRVNESPFRNPDGSMTADAIAGGEIFRSAATGCTTCHRSAQLTDSEIHGNPFLLHNVGTITAASGKRLGTTLTGLDTPTLKGIWETAPYLHDGSAATLMDVLTTRNPSDQHGHTSQLTPTEKQQLVAYLQQVENIARPDFDADGDIDQSDFGFLQLCFTVPLGPIPPGCDGADLDNNLKINDLDFNAFRACQTAPDQLVDVNCAD